MIVLAPDPTSMVVAHDRILECMYVYTMYTYAGAHVLARLAKIGGSAGKGPVDDISFNGSIGPEMC
jgi:hypothetical protein